jgi:superfamily II DNA or RNA helicase
MKATLTVHNTAEVVNVQQRIIKYIKKVMTIDNPAFVQAEKYGRWTGDLDPEIQLYEDTPDGIRFPRGWSRQCLDFLHKNDIQVEVIDHRRTLEPIDLSFRGELRPYQQNAVRDALTREFGVLSAATGSGKTIMALAVIAERRQPTLILVHSKELLDQWRDRIQSFLGIEAGMIGGGKYEIQPVTVGIVNTTRKHLDSLPEHFGQVVVDECHRTPSSMFTEAVTAFDSKYMLGLSATAYRRDGLTKLIYLTLGDQVHEVNPVELKANGAVMTPEVIRRETAFRYQYQDDYPAMISNLTRDRERNEQIAHDVIRQAQSRPGACLVVSDRVQHCMDLAGLLEGHNLSIRVLTGKTPAKDRESIVEAVQAGEVNVLVSTVQLLGEGFDCFGLSSLFLATPIKFKGRVLQVVGRILRPQDGKQPVVFDYVDHNVGVLKAQSYTRGRALKEVAA